MTDKINLNPFDHIKKLQARIEALEAALDALQSAETAYRMSYGLYGYHNQSTLEARDALGIAGYRARKVLSASRAALDKDACNNT